MEWVITGVEDHFADTGGYHFELPILRGFKFRSGLGLTLFLQIEGYPQTLNALSGLGFQDIFSLALVKATAEML
ncbi:MULTISPECIES: hypothetical protein [Spirulina sp. CCY15215]|uniref:hypothetical protein n=1 Tax=Spirulina sp. CCY15215 TaxID=2767591 RepID=UPI001951AC62|nr:hypothetical protein [Spirulina major]